MKIGISATVLTLIFSLISMVYYYFTVKKDEKNIRTARNLFYVSSFLIWFQAILLYYGIFTHHFEWQYVYSYTSRDLSLYYLISTFWAGQEGTFLLWLLLSTVYGMLVIRKKSKYEAVVMFILLAVQAFIAFILIKQNPFAFVWDKHPESWAIGSIPADGNGLNPLLQDPWMIIHPPILFIGYSASVLLYAFAMAGLYYQEYDQWLKESYPYAIFTATNLGAGIILGGYWAYTTLGWGGYWGWDPVENSSLIPWVTSLAFIHSALIQKRQKGLRKTNFFLAILTFVLVLWGSFLTRSGVLADFSVHSFADEGINVYLISFVLFFFLGGYAALAYRFKNISSEKATDKFFTRRNMMLYGMMALLIIAILTLLGTNAPLISSLFYENPSAISSDYYNNVNMPITILIMMTIAISSLLSWKTEGGEIKRALFINGGISIVLTLFVAIFYLHHIQGILIFLFSIFAILVSIRLVIKLIKQKNRGFGGYLTHLGFSLMMIGILTTTLLDSNTKVNLPQGVPVKVYDYILTYKQFLQRPNNNSVAIVNVKLPDGSNYDAEMKYYWSQYNRGYMRNPHVYNRITEDIYVSPLQRFKNKHNPKSKGKLLTLSKNEPAEFEKYTLLFSGYDMGSSEMGNGTMVIKAIIQLRDNETNIQSIVKPGIRAKGKEKTEIPAIIEGTKTTILIKNINVAAKNLTIVIVDESQMDDQQAKPTETLAVEVDIKPFIAVLWIGTILTILGMVFSQINSLRKSKRQPSEIE